jgi:hypothetical protein
MATNTNVARGLIPYAHYDGSVWNGSGNIYYVAAGYTAANIYIGDPLTIHSASNDANGIPAVQLGVTGSPIIGVMLGIVDGGPFAATTIAVTRDLPTYHTLGTAQYILVSDDPTLLYLVQDDASSNTTFAPQVWAGKNANFVSGSGNTTTGYSGYQLAASGVATTNTLDLKIIRPLNSADNLIGTTTNTNMNAKWLVKLNNYQYANQEAGG